MDDGQNNHANLRHEQPSAAGHYQRCRYSFINNVLNTDTLGSTIVISRHMCFETSVTKARSSAGPFHFVAPVVALGADAVGGDDLG